MHRLAPAFAALAALASATALASGRPSADLEEVVVTARRIEFVASVESASQGTVHAEQLEHRPELRPAEMLEVVPGLVVTQHSGDGKANQYFLRGFNLDHGTDFATRVDGVPVNQPTHAHGQGYTDLNFVIPELVDHIDYRKGTYYAEEGNFSAAGAADIHLRRQVDAPFAVLTGGGDGYGSAIVAASPQAAGGDLLMAAQYLHNDGPWDHPEAYGKSVGLLKYTTGGPECGWDVLALGYDGHWHSSDQIPLRAVAGGLIDRYGTIDPTDSGRTSRYALSGDWWQEAGPGQLRANAYAIDSRLDLVSNFTYATDAVHGDQFEQFEHRHTVGGSVAYEEPLVLAGREATLRAGVEVRSDELAPVALYRTTDAVRYATVAEDAVWQIGAAAYASGSVRWTPWLRTDLGARFDAYHFRVDSDLAANSGTANDSIASPKLTLEFGPWSRTEYFVNFGRGYHSNDARGTTITVDPNDGVTPVARVTPLVRATGSEVGVRSAAVAPLEFALSLWTLKLDSELVFSGDGGTTEPSRASRRSGVEVGAFCAVATHVVLDADVAWTHARYINAGAVGDRIPNAVETVVSGGVELSGARRWFGSARLRYFGPAPLIEDNSVRSGSTLLVNLDAGYHLTPAIDLSATVFNLFDRRDNDITYYYASRLPGEAVPVADYHFHPIEPRTLRVSLTMRLR